MNKKNDDIYNIDNIDNIDNINQKNNKDNIDDINICVCNLCYLTGKFFNFPIVILQNTGISKNPIFIMLCLIMFGISIVSLIFYLFFSFVLFITKIIRI